MNKKSIVFCVICFFLGVLVCYFFFPCRYKLYFAPGGHACFKLDTINGKVWRYEEAGFVLCNQITPVDLSDIALELQGLSVPK